MNRRKPTLKQAVALMRLMDAINEGTGDDNLYQVNPGPSSSQSSSLSTALDLGHSVSKQSSLAVTARSYKKALPVTGEPHNCVV